MRTLVLTAVLAVATASSSFANSCSTQGEECKAWAGGQGVQAAKYSAACAREVSACFIRCKRGKRFFVGVFKGTGGGQQYPVTECN
jgi:hypothetical protein